MSKKTFSLLIYLLGAAVGLIYGLILSAISEETAIVLHVAGLVFSHYAWVKNPIPADGMVRMLVTQYEPQFNITAILGNVIFLTVLLKSGFSIYWVGLVTMGIVYLFWQNSVSKKICAELAWMEIK